MARYFFPFIFVWYKILILQVFTENIHFFLRHLAFLVWKKKSKMGKRIKCLNLNLIFFDELIAIRGCRFGATNYGQQ